MRGEERGKKPGALGKAKKATVRVGKAVETAPPRTVHVVNVTEETTPPRTVHVVRVTEETAPPRTVHIVRVTEETTPPRTVKVCTRQRGRAR